MSESIASASPTRMLQKKTSDVDLTTMNWHIPPTRGGGVQDFGASMKRWSGVKGGVYHLVQTMDQFWEFFGECEKQNTIAVDTETSGLDWVTSHMCGIVIGWGINYNFYLPIAHKTGDLQLDLAKIREPLQRILGDEKVAKIFWNAKFDLHFLRKGGLEVKGPMHDGIVMVHLLDENSAKALKDLSVAQISPHASRWEKLVLMWRKGEASRRRKAYSSVVADYVKDNRIEVEAKVLPFAKFSSLTKAQIVAKLKKYVRDHIYVDHPLSDNKLENVSYDYLPLDIMTPYACADVHYTLLLYKDKLSQLAVHDDLRRLYINEMDLSGLLFEVESRGVKIDVPYLKDKIPEFKEKLAAITKEVYADVGFEFCIDSPSQLSEALFKSGCRLTKLTKKGKDRQNLGEKLEPKHYSTDRDTLEYLASQYPFAAKILTYRTSVKMLNTYVTKISEMVDEDRHLHSTFNANVSTGRMSSREPNVQNIPGRDKIIRRAFTIPEVVGQEGEEASSSEWVYLFADYSQVELRLTAHYSNDATLLAAYPWAGEAKDVHSITCAEVIADVPVDEFMAVYLDESHPLHAEYKWLRNIAKRVNFGIIYGAGPGAIQRQVSTPDRLVSRDQCERYIQKYLQKYSGVKQWIDKTTLALYRHGYLRNTFGRFRRLPDSSSRENWKRERAGRQGVNFLIQGDAADLFKHAVVRVDKLLESEGAKTKIVNFVHDEIQFYWHKDELHLIEPVKKVMEDFPQYSVPIVVDLEYSKRDWASKKGLKLCEINKILT